MNSLQRSKEVSSCCGARAKVNMIARAVDGATRFMFCVKCGEPCDVKTDKPVARKTTGERDLFVRLYADCKGRSQVSGEPLLPPDDQRFHFQGCHLLPKGSYQNDRLEDANVVMVTPEEQTEEWPFVKELTDEELKREGMDKWIPVVTRFRALPLKYNQRLNAELSGKA